MSVEHESKVSVEQAESDATDSAPHNATSADGGSSNGGSPDGGERGLTGSAQAQAASRARRIGGGSRPTPGPRATPGSGVKPGRQPESGSRRGAGRGSVLGRRGMSGLGLGTPRKADEGDAATPRSSRTAESARRRPSPVPRTRAAVREQSRPALLAWLPAVIAAALVVALVVVDLLLYASWRDQPSKAERREQLLASVNSSVAKVLSYDYRHLDQDANAAAAGLTGTFKDDYTKSMATTVKKDAPGVKAIVTGEVGSSGIASVSGDGKQAVVLILGQQTVSNTSLKSPRLDSVSLRVTATLVHGKWLIAKLDQL